MEGPVVKISVGVGQFDVDLVILVGRRALVFLGNSNIKEEDRVVSFNLHGELDALALLVDVLEELVKFLSAVPEPDIPESEGGLDMGRLDRFGFKVFHEDDGNRMIEGGNPIAAPCSHLK